jgi:hypothetical protein
MIFLLTTTVSLSNEEITKLLQISKLGCDGISVADDDSPELTLSLLDKHLVDQDGEIHISTVSINAMGKQVVAQCT